MWYLKETFWCRGTMHSASHITLTNKTFYDIFLIQLIANIFCLKMFELRYIKKIYLHERLLLRKRMNGVLLEGFLSCSPVSEV